LYTDTIYKTINLLLIVYGKGYDTLVGERGGLLSGGQRQVKHSLPLHEISCRA